MTTRQIVCARNARNVRRAALALALGGLGAACSAPGSTGPLPCDSVYAGRCGTTCTTDGTCAAGLYCLSSRCTADCAPGARACAAGMLCASNGRCVADPGDGGRGDVVVPPGGDGGTMCPDITVQLARRQATLMLLIDQSGSMTAAFGNTTRWNAIRRTLVDPATGVVHALEAEIQFGLAMYTSHNGASGGACPILRPPLMTALNNYAAISAAMNAAQPDDDTPTAESVTAAAALLQPAPDEEPGTRAIVLATDGEPDTCADPDAQSNPMRQAVARQRSVDAVTAAFAQGTHTYVISVGSEVSQAHLQDLANAGAGTTGATYFRALDPAALTAAFDAITHSVRSCVFRLNGRVDAALAGGGVVTLDGTVLVYNATDGWRLRSASEIELTGAACERARTTGSVLSARFPCDAVTPG